MPVRATTYVAINGIERIYEYVITLLNAPDDAPLFHFRHLNRSKDHRWKMRKASTRQVRMAQTSRLAGEV
jgi:hypothetical protein